MRVQTAMPWGHEEGDLSDSDSWNTPLEVVVPTVEYFAGMVGLDPCSNRFSQVPARVSWTIEDDCLSKPMSEWRLQGIFMNPPYSGPGPFLDKLIEACLEHGAGGIALVKHDHTTAWWERLYANAAAVCMVAQRLKFLAGGKKRIQANFPSSVFLVGGEAADPRRFRRCFRHLGTIVKP